jgi:hypothetical protein
MPTLRCMGMYCVEYTQTALLIVTGSVAGLASGLLGIGGGTIGMFIHTHVAMFNTPPPDQSKTTPWEYSLCVNGVPYVIECIL